MNLNELTQPGWEDPVDYFCERDKMYGTPTLRVPAVVQQQTDDDAVTPVPPTIGHLLECLDMVPGIAQIPPGTSRPGSSHMKLGSVKPQSNASISSLEPSAEHNTSPLPKAKPVEPRSSFPGI